MNDVHYHTIGLFIKDRAFVVPMAVTHSDDDLSLSQLSVHLHTVSLADLVCDLTTRKFLKSRFSSNQHISNAVDEVSFGIFRNATVITGPELDQVAKDLYNIVDI